MPFNIGPMELFIVLVIVLVLFGAKRVPEIGASIGKGIREFKRSLTDTSDAIMSPEDRQKSQLPPRQMDAPPENAPTGGEPKRLSQ